MSISKEDLFPGFKTPPNVGAPPIMPHHALNLDEEQQDRYDEDHEFERCEMCGGDGVIEYMEHPEVWHEDCPSFQNHLLTCPECRGRGA